MKIALFVALAISAPAAELPPQFVRAIHQVESGGRTGAVIGDHGKALGPLQIHRDYWKDSGVAGRYEDCTNLEYSVKVMTAVLNRYASNAVAQQDFATLARIHNGGPRGAQKAATLPYWYKVKKCLEQPGR